MKKVLIIEDDNFEANVAGVVPSFSLLKIGQNSYLYDDNVFDVFSVVDVDVLSKHSRVAVLFWSDVEDIRYKYDNETDHTLYWMDDCEDGRHLLNWHWGEALSLLAYRELFKAAVVPKGIQKS